MAATEVVARSFDALFRSRHGRMVRLAFVLVDTQEEAEEVVQDAFAAVLPPYGRLDNPEACLRLCVLTAVARCCVVEWSSWRCYGPLGSPSAADVGSTTTIFWDDAIASTTSTASP